MDKRGRGRPRYSRPGGRRYISYGPGIQKSHPVFHLQRKAKVHTIKKKKRKQFPAGGTMLYSVASADSASMGFSSRGSKRGWDHG